MLLTIFLSCFFYSLHIAHCTNGTNSWSLPEGRQWVWETHRNYAIQWYNNSLLNQTFDAYLFFDSDSRSDKITDLQTFLKTSVIPTPRNGAFYRISSSGPAYTFHDSHCFNYKSLANAMVQNERLFTDAFSASVSIKFQIIYESD